MLQCILKHWSAPSKENNKGILGYSNSWDYTLGHYTHKKLFERGVLDFT